VLLAEKLSEEANRKWPMANRMIPRHVILNGQGRDYSFSTLILLVLTCKNRRPYNLYCVGGDVKPCSINHSTSCPQYAYSEI